MSIPSFTPGYPPDGSSLGQTKSTLRDNLNGTFLTLGVDHINNNGQPGSQPAGYHNVIRVVPQGSNPGAITGYGQLYSKTINSYTTDQALFWETGAGLIQQLTVNLTPVKANNGYTYLPGGLIMQWGSIPIAKSGTLTPVLFATLNINFPSHCFNVVLTMINNQGASASANSVFVQSGSVSELGFTIINTSSSSTQSAYWLAIGN